MSGFLSTINYSSVNEDWRTERHALRVGDGARVLCVTGSGDRPLHQLLDDPAEVTAIDSNPCQGHLLELKAAAMRTLDYDDYVGFLGLTHCDDRRGLLERVAPEVADGSAQYWRDNAAQACKGVLYAGRFERHYRRVSRIAGLLRGRAIRRLFEFRSLEEQRAFVCDRWDRAWWRLVFDIMCSRRFSRAFLRDPAFYAHVDPDMKVGRYMYGGMRSCLERYLARENFMMSLVFLGRLSEDDLPPYLSRESFQPIRGRLGRLTVVTADVLDALEKAEPGRYTHFSLSDVPSYLDQQGMGRMLDAMVRAAAPGARFCIRQFLSGHSVPQRFERVLRREPELEEQLRLEDRAFAYRFIVGAVQH